MTVNVRGKNIDVTPALRDYVEKKVQTITKQFKVVGEISAVMRVEKDQHIVEITVPASGIVLRAQENTKDMYSSIDSCVDKIERQIHKYKTRLMRRKYSNFREEFVSAAPKDEMDDGEFEIVRNKKYVLRPMNVQEAVMQMNLLNHDFFVYFDDATEGISVVYRRRDGDYGLIAPELK
jgi:putative sigma-54 modulation protein